MAGLRAKQKAQREHNIIEAAERLFRTNGYVHTKIEDIASEAEVSVGTVYNYFENKSALLQTLVSAHDDVISVDFEQLLENLPSDPAKCVCALFLATTGHSLKRLGRENWRHLMGMSIINPLSELRDQYALTNEILLGRTIQILDALQKLGLISTNCDTKQLGGVLYKIEGMIYISLVSNDDMTYDMYKAQLNDDIRFVLHACAST